MQVVAVPVLPGRLALCAGGGRLLPARQRATSEITAASAACCTCYHHDSRTVVATNVPVTTPESFRRATFPRMLSAKHHGKYMR